MKKFRRKDTIIAQHNGHYYPMVIDDGIVYKKDGVDVINAKSLTMKQNYPQPLSKIRINCGQVTPDNLFDNAERDYPEYAIQLAQERKRVEKYSYDRFEIDFNRY